MTTKQYSHHEFSDKFYPIWAVGRLKWWTENCWSLFQLEIHLSSLSWPGAFPIHVSMCDTFSSTKICKSHIWSILNTASVSMKEMDSPNLTISLTFAQSRAKAAQTASLVLSYLSSIFKACTFPDSSARSFSVLFFRTLTRHHDFNKRFYQGNVFCLNCNKLKAELQKPLCSVHCHKQIFLKFISPEKK